MYLFVLDSSLFIGSFSVRSATFIGVLFTVSNFDQPLDRLALSRAFLWFCEGCDVPISLIAFTNSVVSLLSPSATRISAAAGAYGTSQRFVLSVLDCSYTGFLLSIGAHLIRIRITVVSRVGA